MTFPLHRKLSKMHQKPFITIFTKTIEREGVWGSNNLKLEHCSCSPMLAWSYLWAVTTAKCLTFLLFYLGQVIGLWGLTYSIYNGSAFSFASSSVSTIAKLLGGNKASSTTTTPAAPSMSDQRPSPLPFSLSTAASAALLASPQGTRSPSPNQQQLDQTEDMEGPSDRTDEEFGSSESTFNEVERPGVSDVSDDMSARPTLETTEKESWVMSETLSASSSETANNTSEPEQHGKQPAVNEQEPSAHSLRQEASSRIAEDNQAASAVSGKSQSAATSSTSRARA
jgi:hypothetical protein